MNRINSRLLLLLLSAFVFSCTKEERHLKTLDASFQIKEVSYNPDFWDIGLYDTDSVSTGMVSFTANGPDVDSILYEWQVGTDTRTRQMTMNLKALNPSDNKEVTVKFRGTKLQ